MRAAVAEHFPVGTRTSCPVGGAVLWVEMPGKLNSAELFEDALNHGISLAPGAIFSPGNRYRNFLRLSFGHPWSEAIDSSLEWLGQRIHRLAEA